MSTSKIRRRLLVAAGVVSLAVVSPAMAGQPGLNANDNPAVNNAPLNQPTQDEMAQPPQLPAGFISKDEDAAGGVKSTLVSLTNRAVSKDSYNSFFGSFLSDLAARDKARAQEFTGVNQDQLNATITQIQDAWRSKYNQDFDVSDKNLVFNDQFAIVQGEVSDPATAAASLWPVPANYSPAINASASSAQQDCNRKELTQGRPVAIICFPAGDYLPAIRVSMLHQALTGWYVDLPVDRTGEQIYNDLSAQLSYIASHEDQWPSDVTDGYRMVAHHVVAALYGVSAQTGASASAR
jgi:hypothetical protein